MPNAHTSKPAKINSKYKTVPCKLYPTGDCTFGARCTFIHDRVASQVEPPHASIPESGERASDIQPSSLLPRSIQVSESLSKYLPQTITYSDAINAAIVNESRLPDQRRQDFPQIHLKENLQYFDILETSPKTNSEYSTSKFNSMYVSGLYRTKDCKYFLEGTCFQGDRCTFKHDNYKGFSGAEERHPYYRTRPCVYYQMGICAKGDMCTYIHGPIALGITSPRVCKFFVGPGSCRYGNKCPWLHVGSTRVARQPSASTSSDSTYGTGSHADQPSPSTTDSLDDGPAHSLGEDADTEIHPVATASLNDLPFGFSAVHDTVSNDHLKARLDLRESIRALGRNRSQPKQYDGDDDDEVVYSGVSALTSPAVTRSDCTFPRSISLSLSSRLDPR